MLEQALQYAGRGWRVFPVHTTISGVCSCGRDCGKDAGKHPKIKAWQKNATTDPEQIARWWGKWPAANIGIATGKTAVDGLLSGPGLIVLDLDGAEEAQKFAAIASPHGGLRETLTALTGRGLHLYLAGDVLGFTTGKRDGLLIRGDGGYVVAPPSWHASGKRYQWLKDVPLAAAPEWFIEWVQTSGNTTLTANNVALQQLGPRPVFLDSKHKPEQVLSGTTSNATEALQVPQTPYEQKRITSALAAIPASCARDPWLQVGFALHSLAWDRPDGTSIGFDLWDAWSSSCPDKYSRHDVETRWRSFGKPGKGGVGIGTLYHIAAQHGWSPRTVPFEQPAVPYANGHSLSATDFPELAQPASGDPLILLNNQYSCIGDVGGKCLVMGWVPSKVDPLIEVPSFQTFKSFGERYGNKYCFVPKETKDGGTELEAKQLGAYWLKWKDRRSYDGIDLDPAGPALLPRNTLNLWRGFALEPRPGSWELMKRHIAEVLADGDAAALEYIVKWSAWAIQHPGDRAESALVFRGGKGSGKGTFAHALRRLFGAHGLHIANSKHLVGSFNAHLRNCLLLYADEAFWAGDKQGESTLKALITEATLTIEQKGVDAVQWHNRIHLIMTANAEWVVPASHDERRYAVFNVADKYVGNDSYFDALHHEIANGGLAAMLYDLQRAELGAWHPRKIIHTKALLEQKQQSMQPLYEWWEAMLQDACIPSASKDAPDQAMAVYLLNQARDYAPRLKELNATRLGKFLRDMGCVKLHKSNGNAWRFPDVAKARSLWGQRFVGWAWDRECREWEVRA